MKIVAPLVLTLGLSFILYREVGKWNPFEIWPKAEYDAFINRGAGGYVQRQAGQFSGDDLWTRRHNQPEWAKGTAYTGESKADASTVQSQGFQYPGGGVGQSAQNPIKLSNE